MIYVDHAATSPLSPAARAAMEPYLTGAFGNPSSTHAKGREAEGALIDARECLAASLGCSPHEVYFTSGGSEADNQALLTGAAAGAAAGRRHIVSTAIEHPAVLRYLEHLDSQGFTVTLLEPDGAGIVSEHQVAASITPDTCLVSVMAVNNEVGSIQPIQRIAAVCRERGVLVHTDAVQAVGKMPVDMSVWSVDLLTLSAHKFGGPKGIGALIARRGIEPARIVFGGRQERGCRAGTQNVAGAVGMTVACEESCRALKNPATLVRLHDMVDALRSGLAAIPGAHLMSLPGAGIPQVVNACFEGINSETLLMLLGEQGVCASAGSACEAGSLEPSHVLAAMGVDEELARGALRISFGIENTVEEMQQVVEAVGVCVARLRR